MLACFAPVLAYAAGEGSDAQQPESAERAFKLTYGWYRYSGSADAFDVNLRHTSTLGNAWIGHYESSARAERQWRAGWDRTFEFAMLRLLPSLQAADGGFRGGSVFAEAGRAWFAGVGLGRTNLRPYVNLNFDPNDAYSVAFGKRWADGTSVFTTWVRDNRDNPDQRHLHLTYRTPRAEHERLTLDILYKKGLVDGVMIERFGVSVGYDWPRWFLRLSWDPKANFGADDLARLSFGARF